MALDIRVQRDHFNRVYSCVKIFRLQLLNFLLYPVLKMFHLPISFRAIMVATCFVVKFTFFKSPKPKNSDLTQTCYTCIMCLLQPKGCGLRLGLTSNSESTLANPASARFPTL